MQGLQAEILRNDQAIAAGQLACEANQRLAKVVETEKQKTQLFEEQVVSLRHSEATLTSRVTLLEQERDELRNVVEARQAELRESEQKIAKLEAQLSTITENLRTSSAAAHGYKRQHLKEILNFCKYRADALGHLAILRKHTQKITDDSNSKAQECSGLRQDVAELQTQLDFEQTKTNQLKAEISQYDRDINIIKQEKNDAIEKEGRTRESLQAAGNSNQELLNENLQLSTEIEGARKDLLASKITEEQLTLECYKLQKQVNALHDAKSASDAQLHQVQHDIQFRLQQAETDYTASLDDLNTRLKLSEHAREELQAALRQMETRHKEQIENHEEKVNAQFDELVAQSQQEREKLKVEHMQELERCERDAEARVTGVRLGAQRLFNEALQSKAEKAAETEGRFKDVEMSTARILVPGIQQSEQNALPSSQKSQTGRTRKKVDRQTDLVTVIASSSHRRFGSAGSQSIIDENTFAGHHREDSENSRGYRGQENENRLESQVLLQIQEEQCSVLDPPAENIAETQDFQYGQGVAAQFDIIQSQIMASDNVEGDDLTDLSTIPSEDLSEMLMDIRPDSRQHPCNPKHAFSTSNELQTPVQLHHDSTPEAHSTSSRGRPKSRANTATRIVPLTHQDGPRQHTNADQGDDQMSHTRAEQSLSQRNSTSLDSMHSNTVVSDRTDHHRSGHKTESDQKRKAPGNDNDSGSSKRLCTSAQALAQHPSSISKSYAPYLPPSTHTAAQNTSNPTPASVTGRRSNYRQSSVAGSRSATPRLSSTRNTRSKGIWNVLWNCSRG